MGCQWRRNRRARDDADALFGIESFDKAWCDLKLSLRADEGDDWRHWPWLLLLPVIALIGALKEGDITVAQLSNGAEALAVGAAKFSLAGPIADLIGQSLNIGFAQAYALLLAAIVVNICVIAVGLSATRRAA